MDTHPCPRVRGHGGRRQVRVVAGRQRQAVAGDVIVEAGEVDRTETGAGREVVDVRWLCAPGGKLQLRLGGGATSPTHLAPSSAGCRVWPRPTGIRPVVGDVRWVCRSLRIEFGSTPTRQSWPSAAIRLRSARGVPTRESSHVYRQPLQSVCLHTHGAPIGYRPGCGVDRTYAAGSMTSPARRRPFAVCEQPQADRPWAAQLRGNAPGRPGGQSKDSLCCRPGRCPMPRSFRTKG